MSQPPTRLARHLLRTGMMIATLLVAGACVRAASAPTGPDPLHTDGDKYQLVLDNQFVRVLRYHDEPCAMTHLHHHPCFVMYAIGPFQAESRTTKGPRRPPSGSGR